MTVIKSKVLYPLIIFSLLVLSCLTGCKSSTPLVKPDSAAKNHAEELKEKEGSDADDELKMVAQITESGEMESLSNLELLRLHQRNRMHISTINHACEYYHDTYFEYPSDLTELLDDFMLFWPGNVYLGGQIKILNSKPDPSNPDHLGQVFYQRNTYNSAYIKYIKPYWEESIDQEPEWKVVEVEIYSMSAAYLSDPVKLEHSIKGHFYKQMLDMHEDERYVYNFTRNLSQGLSYIMNDALARRGMLEDSFIELLVVGKYYLSKNGYETLKDQVKNHKIYFDMGKYADSNYAYKMNGDPYGEIERDCRKFDPSKGEYGKIIQHVDCPESDNEARSLFSSFNFDELEIPESLLITKEDVL